MAKDLLYKVEVPNYLSIFRNLFWILALYLYIFQPPLFDKRIYLFTQVIIFTVSVLLNSKILFSFIRIFKIEFRILLFLILYSIIRDVFAGEEVYSERFIAWGFQAFFFGYFIVYIYEEGRKRVAKNTAFFSTVYWTCFLGAILSTILIINPSADSFYKNISMEESYLVYETFEERYRGFGVSENLTFTYSYVMGMCAGYSLYVLYRNYLLIVPFFLFFLAVFYNARIGFFAILFLVVFTLFSVKKWFWYLVIGAVSYFLIGYFLSTNQIFGELLDTNSDWVLSSYYDVSSVLWGSDFAGNQGRTTDILLGDFFVFPRDLLGWIFGHGESLFGRSDVQSSDIGYILQLYYGGLFILLPILYFMFYVSRRLYKTYGMSFWYVSFFILSILVLNFKGFLFAATPGGRLLFCLYIYYIYTGMKRHLIK